MKYLINHREEDENKIHEMFTSDIIFVQIYEKTLIDRVSQALLLCVASRLQFLNHAKQ